MSEAHNTKLNFNFPRLTSHFNDIPDLHGYSYRGYFLRLNEYYKLIDSGREDIREQIRQGFSAEFEDENEIYTTIEEHGCEHFSFNTGAALSDIISGTHENWHCWNCISEYQFAWELIASLVGIRAYAGFGQKYVAKSLGYFKGHTMDFGIAEWLELKKPDAPKPLAFSFTVEQAKAELDKIAGKADWSDRVLEIKTIEEISQIINTTPRIEAVYDNCELAVYWMKLSELLNSDFIFFIPSYQIKNLFEDGWWSLDSWKEHFQKK